MAHIRFDHSSGTTDVTMSHRMYSGFLSKTVVRLDLGENFSGFESPFGDEKIAQFRASALSSQDSPPDSNWKAAAGAGAGAEDDVTLQAWHIADLMRHYIKDVISRHDSFLGRRTDQPKTSFRKLQVADFVLKVCRSIFEGDFPAPDSLSLHHLGDEVKLTTDGAGAGAPADDASGAGVAAEAATGEDHNAALLIKALHIAYDAAMLIEKCKRQPNSGNDIQDPAQIAGGNLGWLVLYALRVADKNFDEDIGIRFEEDEVKPSKSSEAAAYTSAAVSQMPAVDRMAYGLIVQAQVDRQKALKARIEARDATRAAQRAAAPTPS